MALVLHSGAGRAETLSPFVSSIQALVAAKVKDEKKGEREEAVQKLKELLFTPAGMSALTSELGQTLGTLLSRVDPVAFDKLQAVISGSLRAQIMRAPKMFNDFDREFAQLVRSVRQDKTDANLDRVNWRLVKNFKWFRGVNAEGIPLTEYQRQAVIEKLKVLVNELPKLTRTTTESSKKLHKLINRRLLPRALPMAILQKIAADFLGPDSIDAIRVMISMDPLHGYKAMARWIELNKISFKDLADKNKNAKYKLTAEEWAGITPLLKYVNVSSYEFPDPTYNGIQQFLSRFVCAETLDISNNHTISTVPLLPNLITLDCHNCSCLTTLPYGMEKLLHLNCRQTRLINLPYDLLQQLITLDCGYCYQLIQPERFKRLEQLRCVYIKWKELPAGLEETLTSLNCSMCNLTMRDGFERLVQLKCSNCEWEYLPRGLVSLQDLDIFDCKNLVVLPAEIIGNLITLNCGGCDSLLLPGGLVRLQTLKCPDCKWEALPGDLVSLTTLDCRYCFYLFTLNIVGKLKELDCSDNNRLHTLTGDFGNLKKFNCSYCPSLFALPQGMKSLKNLNHSYNPQLRVPADLPLDVKIVNRT